jgi:hypothetical protein
VHQVGKVSEEGAIRRLQLDQQGDITIANIHIRAGDRLVAQRLCGRANTVRQVLQPLEMLIGENTGSAGNNF